MSTKFNIMSRGALSWVNREYILTLEDYERIIPNLNSYWRWYDFTDTSKAQGSTASNLISFLWEKTQTSGTYRLTGIGNALSSVPQLYYQDSNGLYYMNIISNVNHYGHMVTNDLTGLTTPSSITTICVMKPDPTQHPSDPSVAVSSAQSGTYSHFVGFDANDYDSNSVSYQNPNPTGADTYTIFVSNKTVRTGDYIEIGADPRGASIWGNKGDYYEFIFLDNPSQSDIDKIVNYYELKYSI